jgi:hypothetical protein
MGEVAIDRTESFPCYQECKSLPDSGELYNLLYLMRQLVEKRLGCFRDNLAEGHRVVKNIPEEVTEKCPKH